MTEEDRKAITDFFERMKKLEAERDPEAERQIDQLMQQNPQTKYYITQMAFFLEHAKVALNDGRLFGPGGDGFVRLNFGCPRALLADALARMARALAAHAGATR